MNLRSKLGPLPFAPGDTVLVGLSGGADSVCLTHLLQTEFPELRIAACHLNHGLRGAESERDEAFVQAFCVQLGIPCYTGRAPVAELAGAKHCGVEEAGREARYAFFEETARRLEAEVSGRVWVATAHTQSDQAETVLFRLVRGSAGRGLGGIPPMRGRVVRPLLSVSREEVEAYCREAGLSYVTDSTNASEAYARNRIRRQVIPELRQVNPAAEEHIARTAGLLREEEEWLAELTATRYAVLERDGALPAAELRSCPAALRRRLLAMFLERNGLPCSFERVARLEELVQSGAGAVELRRQRRVVCAAGWLRVAEPEEDCPYYEFPLREGLFESRTGKVYKIKTLDTLPSAPVNKIYKNVFDIFLDCGKISGSIIIRQKTAGDAIRLPGRGCTKTLKKLFQEAGIPPLRRLQCFVMADRQGVVAVEGIGVAERVCCGPATTRAVSIRQVKGTEQDEG